MRKFYFFLKLVFYSTIILAVIAVGAGYYFLEKFSKDLPQLDSLRDYSPPQVSQVFAEDGTKIGEFFTENRIVLKPNEIPDLLKKAIISSEDQSFFEHSGIDYLGILRAAIENFKAGETVQGGSTISQQVVKTFFLSPERSYERKIKEALLARKLEQSFNKEEILYLYLNQIFLGNRAYGIEVAAQNYFHKTARELNIAEAAMLAGLTKFPGKFNPIRNFNRAKERQHYVIERMYAEGYISEEEKKAAFSAPLKIYEAPTDKEFNLQYAPWFVEEIRRRLIDKYGEDTVNKGGLKIYTPLNLKGHNAAHNAVNNGLELLHKRHGYKGPVKKLSKNEYASFASEQHKKMVLENVEAGLRYQWSDDTIQNTKATPKSGQTYYGIVTGIDKKTGAAQLLVGQISGLIIARDFGWARPRSNGSSGYNDAIYVRDPAKVFSIGDVVETRLISEERKSKSKEYLADQTYFSLEQTPDIEGALFSYEPKTGYVRAVIGGKDFSKGEFNRATQAKRQTGSVIKALLYAAALDKGYTPDTVIQDAPLEYKTGTEVWRPQNYGGGYRGAMSFREALIYSRNVVSARIIIDIGVEYMTGYLRKLGIDTPIVKVPSMSLGAVEMKLEEITRAFGVFPNSGVLPQLIYYTKIIDKNGNILESNQPQVVKHYKDQIKEGTFKGQAQMTLDPKGNEINLRSDLWASAKKWIITDKLTLTPYEEIILYGKYIPDGYVISPKSAYQMVDIMRDIVRRGTATVVNNLARPAAGKTGTTNDLTDCWFVGYTPNLVAGVWVGYDENKYKVGGGETGGHAAAPIFLEFMKKYLDGTEIAQFEVPDTSTYAALKSPVDISPHPAESNTGTVNVSGGGGADFFLNDF